MLEGHYEREIGEKKESSESKSFMDANEVARTRFRHDQPEAGIEIGLESESGRNEKIPPKKPISKGLDVYMDAYEAAERRIQNEKQDTKKAAEIREEIMNKLKNS